MKLFLYFDFFVIIGIIEFTRLEYTAFDENKDFHIDSEYGITFQELKLSKVGDKFSANPDPADASYMNEIAEVLYVDDRSVLVRVTEQVKTEDGLNSVVHIEHVDLF